MPLDSDMQANFVRLDPEVEVPTRSHIGDAAVDLQCRTDVTISPGERVSVPTGIAVGIPDGYAGLVLPRSGHALRSGIGIVNGPGLIDSGYRGEISVLLINHGSDTVSFAKGDRIAQLAVVPVATVDWVEVGELEETTRGSGGFGSTGT